LAKRRIDRRARLLGGVDRDMLRAKGGVEMTERTTEVTTRILAFTQGKGSVEDLVRYLTHEVRYEPTAACPWPPSFAERRAHPAAGRRSARS
jgi:hypothetical protein